MGYTTPTRTPCPIQSAQVELKVDECKPLEPGAGAGAADPIDGEVVTPAAAAAAEKEARARGRGVHSSTFQLNVSAFYGTGGAFRGCVGGVGEVLGGKRSYTGCISRQNWLRLS